MQNVTEFKNLEDKVGNIQIGGRNLLLGTKGFSDGWAGIGFLQPDTYLGLSVYFSHALEDEIYREIRYQSTMILPGTEYTLSVYAKGTGYLTTYVHPNTGATILATNGDPSWIGKVPNDGHCDYPLTEDWKRYFVTFRTTDDPTKINPAGTKKNVLFRVLRGNSAYICGAKLEKGNVPSDWSPAPEDSSDSGLQFIRQIFPDGVVNNAATVSQLLAVRDEKKNIVAGIYGGGAPELEANGFKDNEHGKLMIFAGASEGIDDKGVEKAGTRIYADGTLITSRLIATNADITGNIIAKTGSIGQFNIDGIWLRARGTDYSMALSAAAFQLECSDHTTGDGVLDNVHLYMAAYPSAVYNSFEVLNIESNFTTKSPTSTFTNTGIYLNITGAIKSWNPYGGNHALYIEHGDICGFRLFTRRITGEYNINIKDSVILCWNATLTLPAEPEDGQIYFIKQIYSGAITLKVGASDHYINDGRTNKKDLWRWDSGTIVIVIWDYLNKCWHAGFTNNN